ncbi:hypothetical protein OG992_30850 [Micromonospora sp. NBC_00362]|uniref:hypothetical protein n=1 Tax=Micromonospora sp. NBC_00362 TaxID=2975975 RepID=UPI00225AD4A1|nr:hypothetical protein [Micromonospora sp. NBC_00362]MCX5121584.1 hypothetical protein [Micromonospora sp. NBC_00362]
MSPFVVILLLVGGLSEAAGRLLPVVARLSGVSHVRVVSLLLGGAIVDGAVFALWPLSAWAVAGLVLPTAPSDALIWTPGLAAPLVLAGVLAFPLLGPLLHLLLMVGVGAGLAGALATVAGVGWWEAAGCVAVAGVGLGVTVEAVRRLVVKLNTTRAPESVA